MDEFMTIPEVIAGAKKNLSKEMWDYGAGGSDSEATLRRNRLALSRLALLPHVLRDVSSRSTKTTFLGHPLSLPIMSAPVGSMQHFHSEGTLAVVRAVGQAGSIGWISTATNPIMEEVAQAACGPLIFQLYVRGDRTWVERMIHRAEEAGYVAICITVDMPAYSRRNRDLQNRFAPRSAVANLAGVDRDSTYQAMMTWEDLTWVRRATKLPLILKGIMAPSDARRAMEYGVDAIVVSNHGGRQLDHAPASMDVLESVVDAVDGRAEIVVDGGFTRGADVLKAIALGARAVLVGKLFCWAMAAGGEAAVRRTIELLQIEIDLAMANIGVSQPSDLSPEFLFRTPTPLSSDTMDL